MAKKKKASKAKKTEGEGNWEDPPAEESEAEEAEETEEVEESEPKKESLLDKAKHALHIGEKEEAEEKPTPAKKPKVGERKNPADVPGKDRKFL